MTDSLMTDQQQPLGTSFQAAVRTVATLVIEAFEREIDSKQLYYHGIEHVEGVVRRAKFIFDMVVPFYEQGKQSQSDPTQSIHTDWSRQRELLYLSAIAHDMQQLFRPQTLPNTPRQRRSGESEKASIKKLIGFIQQVDASESDISKTNILELEDISNSTESTQTAYTHFKPDDITLLEEAIEATVCQYDANEGSIYQPWLYAEYRNGQPISLVARCLALADIGTLGIDGIEAYNREGSLLLLEENLDIIPFLKNETDFDSLFQENVRQRLLKRARFEIAFAKGRLNRLDQELAGLPVGAIAQLKEKVFKYLTPETIQTLEIMTPTAAETSLSKLLHYFQLQSYAHPKNLRAD